MNEYMKIEKIDAAFCYPRTDQHQQVVFLDISLADLSAAQLRDYQEALAGAYDGVPPNTRIMVFTTAADVQRTLVRPVITICKPPATETEQKAIAAPSETTPLLKRRAAEARATYDTEVEKVLADVQDPIKRAGDSPILEQVRGISNYAGFRGASRSLTWVSDGIQNSEAGRFCTKKGEMPSYATFAKRPAFTFLKPNSFAGTDVSVLLVESIRLPQAGLEFCSNAEMRRWWVDYFKGNGADRVALTPLRRWAGS